jgi:hypothetical protein
MNEKHNGPRAEWRIVHTEERDGIVMQVSRLDLPRPLYSMGVGRRAENGRLMPHIQVRREETLSGIYLSRAYGLVIGELAEAGEKFITAAMEADLAEYIATREERDLHNAKYGKARARVTGKTDKKREKKAAPASGTVLR